MDATLLEAEISELKRVLQLKENELLRLKENETSEFSHVTKVVNHLPRWAIERYSRQFLVEELGGAEGAKTLMKASVLVVGAGGLGCPAAGYLAGAGIGHIGIIDYDTVEITNIHRQLLHSESTVGMTKVQSAADALKRINSKIKITPFNLQLDSSNAMDILIQFDVIIDATDNVVTRYLLNDSCVMLQRPLVSASALKLEGQFTVYNYKKNEDSEKGPCLRCVFPLPPPPETVGSCSQNGVLGPIPGTLGCLQAVEAIKVLLGLCSLSGRLLLYDGLECSFRKVKLRKRDPKCAVCSDNPTVTQLIDYTLFCKAQASDKEMKLEILVPEERISPVIFANSVYPNIKDLSTGNTRTAPIENSLYTNYSGKNILLDVRAKGEFDMCNIEGSFNLPITVIPKECERLVNFVKEKNIKEVYFICRRGNDSQIAVRDFRDKYALMFPSKTLPIIKDVIGGLHLWSKEVDSEFPIY